MPESRMFNPGRVGPKGDKGDKGDPGSSTGVVGPTGPQGPQGLKGDKGDTGTPGSNGTNGSSGTNGTAGATGPAGPQGPQGAAGAPGAYGWRFGTAVPSNALGNDGDFFLDTTSRIVYSKLGSWGPTGFLAPYDIGGVGASWRIGTTAPDNSTGHDGDFYLNTVTREIFGKVAGVFGSRGFLTDGSPTTGIWRDGTTVPANTLGNDGDFYLKTDTKDVYEKKSGVYGVVGSIANSSGGGSQWGRGAPPNSPAPADNLYYFDPVQVSFRVGINSIGANLIYYSNAGTWHPLGPIPDFEALGEYGFPTFFSRSTDPTTQNAALNSFWLNSTNGKIFELTAGAPTYTWTLRGSLSSGTGTQIYLNTGNPNSYYPAPTTPGNLYVDEQTIQIPNGNYVQSGHRVYVSAPDGFWNYEGLLLSLDNLATFYAGTVNPSGNLQSHNGDFYLNKISRELFEAAGGDFQSVGFLSATSGGGGGGGGAQIYYLNGNPYSSTVPTAAPNSLYFDIDVYQIINGLKTFDFHFAYIADAQGNWQSLGRIVDFNQNIGAFFALDIDPQGNINAYAGDIVLNRQSREVFEASGGNFNSVGFLSATSGGGGGGGSTNYFESGNPNTSRPAPVPPGSIYVDQNGYYINNARNTFYGKKFYIADTNGNWNDIGQIYNFTQSSIPALFSGSLNPQGYAPNNLGDFYLNTTSKELFEASGGLFVSRGFLSPTKVVEKTWNKELRTVSASEASTQSLLLTQQTIPNSLTVSLNKFSNATLFYTLLQGRNYTLSEFANFSVIASQPTSTDSIYVAIRGPGGTYSGPIANDTTRGGPSYVAGATGSIDSIETKAARRFGNAAANASGPIRVRAYLIGTSTPLAQSTNTYDASIYNTLNAMQTTVWNFSPPLPVTAGTEYAFLYEQDTLGSISVTASLWIVTIYGTYSSAFPNIKLANRDSSLDNVSSFANSPYLVVTGSAGATQTKIDFLNAPSPFTIAQNDVISVQYQY